MGHNIIALIVREPFDETAARDWDVAGVPLGHGLRLVHLSDSYTAVQQHRRGGGATLDVPDDFPSDFPREGVVADLAAAVTGAGPATFALVMTEYFGGAGEQWAALFVAGRRDPDVVAVNGALRGLGVVAGPGQDEFDTVGLASHRSTPEELDRYEDLCGGSAGSRAGQDLSGGL